jgi:hypothetical protein
MPEQMSEDELKVLVAREIANVNTDGAALAKKRTRALNYYQGVMDDVPSELGRSSAVSLDFADTVQWVLPGVIRVFTGSEQMAIAEPAEPGDEEAAKQATDLMNYTFMKDNDGYRILYSAIWDSLTQANGIIKSWWDDTPQHSVSFHTGLTEDQRAELLEPDEDDNEPEVLASSERKVMIDGDVDALSGLMGPPQEITVYDVKIRRVTSAGRVMVECVSPDDYGIDGDAETGSKARFQFHRAHKSRSELIEMGFDADKIDSIAPVTGNETAEQTARDPSRNGGEGDRSTDLIDLYECYVRADVDGDGMSELCRVYYGGPPDGGELLDWEVWEDDEDGAPFDDIPCDPMPHRWEARSLFDKTMDIQRIKSVLKRNALDNTYASNNPQRFVKGNITNPEELFSPNFGGAVFGDATAEVTNLTIAYVADKAYAAMEYEDQVIQRRTGVSRQTLALDPNALQEQTATASQIEHDASYSQIELLARNMAELGWKKVFRRILRLLIKHQDKPKTIRIRGKFIEVDPRAWNADMDVTINVGLGTGSRERDMQMLQTILANQVALTDRLQAGGFGDKALEMLPYIRKNLVGQAEASGIRSPDAYYPEVTAEDIAAGKQRIAQMQGQPPVEIQVATLKAQSEQAIQQSEAQSNQIKAQAEAQKSGTEAQVKQLEAQIAAQKQQFDAARAQEELRIRELEISAKNDTQIKLKAMEIQGQLEAARIAAGADIETLAFSKYLDSLIGMQEHEQAKEIIATQAQFAPDPQPADTGAAP